jgi:DNA-binding NarL/FixJ family response regulator
LEAIPTRENATSFVVITGGPVLAREGVAMLLEGTFGIPVRTHAGDIAEAMTHLREDVGRFVALVVTPSGGFDVAGVRTFASHPECVGIVVAGGFRTKHDVMRVLEAGAQSCVSYDAGTARLVEAIERARAGTGYLCPIVAALLARDTQSRPAPQLPLRELTDRERDVLALIVEGMTDRQAAAELGLSMKTVHTHRQNIMAKLGVRTATALVRRAIQLGLVVP